jgi:hypothetical protein
MKSIKNLFVTFLVLGACSNSTPETNSKKIYLITEKQIHLANDTMATYYYSQESYMWKGITKLDSFDANRKLYYVGDTVIR